MSYCLIYTLTDNIDEAKRIAHGLVKEKHAACCNIVENITSVYEWKEEICEDKEYLVLAKTKKCLFKQATEYIKQNHSYELPAILMLPIETGLQGFLDWIDKTTR